MVSYHNIATNGSRVRNVRVAGKRIDLDDWGFCDRPIGRFLVYFAMLAFCIACWAAIIMLIARVAHASPLECESIKDADQRHYCQAVSIPRRSECELIKKKDLRRLCRAQVK